MGKGFFSGIIAGLLVSFGFFLVLSTMVPIKVPAPAPAEQPADNVETAAAEREQQSSDTEATAEQVSEAADSSVETADVAATETPAEQPEAAAAPVPMPKPDTQRPQTSVVNSVDLPGGSSFSAPETPAGTETGGSDSTPLANTKSAALPQVTDDPTQAPEAPSAGAGAVPENVTDTDPVRPSPAVPAPVAPVGESLPSTPESPGIVRKAVPGVTIVQPNVEVNRLPSIEAEETEAGSEEQSEAAPSVDEAAQPTGIALNDNAVAFEAMPGKPVLALVLRDIGGGGVDVSAWSEVDIPITFAVDPSREDAAETAQAYRNAGHEVVLLATGLPQGATAQDLEVNLAKYLADVPGAVALMPDITSQKPFSQPLIRQLVSIASQSGHGVVVDGTGLGGGQGLRDDVPLARVSRIFDADGEDATTQRRLLDRASFDAAQNRSGVVFGHTYPWTFVTVQEWAKAGPEGDVQLAPLSAVLNARP